MLQKYVEFTPHREVDTYPLSKALLHFLPSYALDVINEQLRKTNNHRKSEHDQYHDALHDSYLSYNLCRHLFTKIDTTRRQTLMVDRCIQKSDGMISDLIDRSQKEFTYESQKLFLPPLRKFMSTTSQKKLILDEVYKPEDLKPLSLTDLSQIDLKHFLEHLDW